MWHPGALAAPESTGCRLQTALSDAQSYFIKGIITDMFEQ